MDGRINLKARLALAIFLLCSACFTAQGEYVDEVMADDPVLYLRFEQEPLVDSSGNNYWVDANDEVIIEQTQDSIGKAAYLNGGWVAAANQTFEPCLPTDYNHAYAFAPNDITFEFWLCTPQPNDVFTYAQLFSQSETLFYEVYYPRGRYAPEATRAGTKIRMAFGDNRDPLPEDNWAYSSEGAWVSDANWHHYVFVWDEHQPDTNQITVKLYRDGVLYKDSTYGPPDRNDVPVLGYIGPEMDHIIIGCLGSRDAPDINPYQQYIDEFAIYSGILPLSRIQAHYAAGGPINCLYVDGSATGANDGTSWEDAFNYLQDVLADPNFIGPAEIRVAQGTYKPDEASYVAITLGDRAATFQLMNGVAIYGGFPSGGGWWSNRNPDIYQTILSGDINVPDVYTDNSYHVVTASGTDTNAVLDGFIITAGNANGMDPCSSDGGGLCNYNGSPTISNCTFTNNLASYAGGGMGNYNYSSPTVTDCTFTSNSTIGDGGGMYNYNYSSPTVTGCTFGGNSADNGGGIWNEHYSSPEVTNCTFIGNSALTGFGGGMSTDSGNPTVTNCTFNGNFSDHGGGMFNNSSSPTVTNCTFSYNMTYYNGGGMANGIAGSPIVTNCTFISNSADYGDGGGMYNNTSSNPTLTNCTFMGNTAEYGGGIHSYYHCDAKLKNCILWVNTAWTSGNEIALQNSSNIDVNYCDVQGGQAAIYNDGTATIYWDGESNIDQNPLFRDAEGHLWCDSPCINAGDPNGDYSGQTDIDGQPRVLEGRVDIGADEVPPPIQNIDTNEVYDTIQEAINGANDLETIVVQPGIYTGGGNREIEFLGKAITLRSSDPGDPNVVAATVIDCNGFGRGFIFWEYEDVNSVLDGFTIANGYTAEVEGGGIFCYFSSPTIKNCIIRDNTSAVADGGGIYCVSGSPTIENCIIRNNTATMADGGGIYCVDSSPTIKNCTIRNNTVTASEGGGIYCDANSVLTINGGMIMDNNPDGIWVDGTALILGTVHVISNDLVGDGTVQIDPSGSLDLDDAHVFCSMSGAGTMEVALGAKATIDSDAVIDLGDPCDPNVKGTIDCEGLLIVRDNGRITKAKINITKASFKNMASISNSEIHVDSKAPYGSVFAEPNTSFVDVNIYADGDRYMDLDPLIFDGNFVNVKIFVTITEGVGTRFGGLFECRGDDGFADVNWFDPNSPFLLNAVSGTIPDCDPNTWTIEEVNLVAGAKLNLSNRFPFQEESDYNDVVYVKNLILGPNSVLNLSFNKLYYGSLSMDPSAVVTNLPLLGFSVINIAMDDQTEYIVRVAHNNYTHPNNPNYDRVHIKRVTGLSLDPNGVMRMRALKDENPCSPTYQQDVNACAKGTFAKTSEDEDVAIEFEYMFTADPCGDAELVVYLSDDPELGQNLWEVGRVRPPASGRPGSIGSNRFAVFTGLFPAESFYFIRGTYIELRLLGSANAGCLINNWDPKVNCIGICGDFNIEEPFPLNIVDIYDYLVLLAESGLCNPGSVGKGCLDLIGDGHVNNDDVLAWGTDELLHACGGGGGGGGGGGYGPSAAGASVTGETLLTVPASEKQILSITEPLLICGKPLSGSGTEVPYNYLYSVDTDGVCVSADPTSSAGRLVTDRDGIVYQIDGYLGLINLETQTAVVEPNTIYYEGSSVVVGYDNGAGLLLSDAVFNPDDSSIVYVVPVQVDPLDGNCPYMAAAKLQLTGGGSYSLEKLYGKNPATDPCQQNTITDCDGELLYEPDVQNLHEIEIDSDGYLYVLSSDWFNDNNWLLVYYEGIGNDSEERLPLASYNITGPTAMVVLPYVDRLYLASSSDGPSDLISTVYRFSIDKMIPPSISLYEGGNVEISCPAPGVCGTYPSMCDPNLGYVSMITSMVKSPVDGSVYVTGFTAPKFPNDVTMSSWPYNQAGGIFTTPMLAEVRLGASGTIGAVNITGGSLVLPFSLVWTGSLTPPEEKCGGADIYVDGTVNLKDFGFLAKYWRENNCYALNNCEGADLEPEIFPDGDVDIEDLAVLCQHWLENDCLD